MLCLAVGGSTSSSDSGLRLAKLNGFDRFGGVGFGVGLLALAIDAGGGCCCCCFGGVGFSGDFSITGSPSSSNRLVTMSSITTLCRAFPVVFPEDWLLFCVALLGLCCACCCCVCGCFCCCDCCCCC